MEGARQGCWVLLSSLSHELREALSRLVDGMSLCVCPWMCPLRLSVPMSTWKAVRGGVRGAMGEG